MATIIEKLIVSNLEVSDCRIEMVVGGEDIIDLGNRKKGVNVPFVGNEFDVESLIFEGLEGEYSVGIEPSRKEGDERKVKVYDVRRTRGLVAAGDSVKEVGNRLIINDSINNTISSFSWPSDRYFVVEDVISHMLTVHSDKESIKAPLKMAYTIKEGLGVGLTYRAVFGLVHSTSDNLDLILTLSNSYKPITFARIGTVTVNYVPSNPHGSLYSLEETAVSPSYALKRRAASSSSSSSSSSPSLMLSGEGEGEELAASSQLSFDMKYQDLAVSSKLCSVSKSRLNSTLAFYAKEDERNPKPWLLLEDNPKLLELPITLIYNSIEFGSGVVKKTHPSDTSFHQPVHKVAFSPVTFVTISSKSEQITQDAENHNSMESKSIIITNTSWSDFTFNYIVDALHPNGKVVIKDSSTHRGYKLADKFIPPMNMQYSPTLRVITNITVKGNTTADLHYDIIYPIS